MTETDLNEDIIADIEEALTELGTRIMMVRAAAIVAEQTVTGREGRYAVNAVRKHLDETGALLTEIEKALDSLGEPEEPEETPRRTEAPRGNSSRPARSSRLSRRGAE